jgi:NADPH-dependent 2,4-dienoyl-CoA reductase/sulfur reductase-like enzyme/nitrite reductase/ring-hydroxylating ferredoxin subunit
LQIGPRNSGEIAMAQSDQAPTGPDLAQGVPLSSLPASGILAGHVDGKAVLLSRQGDGIFAVSGVCSHYGAPLAEGLVVDGEVRCPWHHACFSLRTGQATKAPAFAALTTWRVETVGDTVFVRAELEVSDAPPTRPGTDPKRIVIIGGGAAGYAAAVRLRELGFGGSLTMLSADDAAPCDRPNLSKDYLAGTAPEDWIPLQSAEFYAEKNIDLRLDCEVASIDSRSRNVVTRSGERHAYDALLIATGAEPVRLPTPWSGLPNAFALRSLADARRIIAATAGAKSAVLIGAGFISMEAAGALRTRGLDVHVIAREQVPLARVFGPEFGGFVTRLHEEHGVVFHLQAAVADFDGKTVVLADGTRIPADLLIVGVGVKPRIELATAAGLAVQDGILVDEYLQTSDPAIFAAGDVARYRCGAEHLRIEHWVHAQRQGQAAAANMLGAKRVFDDVPFFWTNHYGLDLRYTGHAADWDELRIDGSLTAHDCMARFFRAGKLLAAASIGRELENLAVEAKLRS